MFCFPSLCSRGSCDSVPEAEPLPGADAASLGPGGSDRLLAAIAAAESNAHHLEPHHVGPQSADLHVLLHVYCFYGA